MMRSPNDSEPLLKRLRRFSRGIVLALVLTFAALLFLSATLLGEPQTQASSDSPPLAETLPASSQTIKETGSLPPPRPGI